MNKNEFNNKGFSLVEVLVATLIMMILGYTMMELINTQQKEVRALSQQLIIKDLETSARKLLSNESYCKCLFNGITLDTSGIAFSSNPSTFPIGFPNAPTDCSFDSSKLLFQVHPTGTPSDFSQNSGIFVDSIQLNNTILSTPGSFSSRLNLHFNQDSLVRQLKPLDIMMFFTVDTSSGSPSARPIRSCNSIGISSQNYELTPGTHCDIGGPWGWRDGSSVCPSGSNIAIEAPCPTGSSRYGNGCYFSNSNPDSPYGSCGDSADECCFYLCKRSNCERTGMIMTCN